jgi:DNA (cytosine-5)-methyltransferase 1
MGENEADGGSDPRWHTTQDRERGSARWSEMDVPNEKKKHDDKNDALMTERKLRFIDLFSGCGGFTLGMERAGLHAVAAVDFNTQAIATLKTNLSHIPHVLERDLTKFGPEALEALIGDDPVDVIVGGPPCQGFSTARQRDGANHGSLRLIDDPRRHLYKSFLRYVAYFRPRLFVIENVLGLRSAAGGAYFTRVHEEARSLGYRVHGQIEDAWELGAPQKRRRQLIIGVRNDVPGYFPTELKPPPHVTRRPSLGSAIGDLPVLRAGAGEDESDYDMARRKKWLARSGSKARRFLYGVVEAGLSKVLTNHVSRPHSARDLRDFERLHEGETSAVAMRDRAVTFEFPYDKTTFKDRYTKQSRSKPCSTIVAHMSKDGLMFIHPTQNRSLTPREAARVQTFPDWFRFPRARTHAFRLIGNAVPPVVSEAVGLAVQKFLQEQRSLHLVPTSPRHQQSPNTKNVRGRATAMTARTYIQAVPEVQRLADCTPRSLRSLPASDFASAWRSLLFLLPQLHPAGALDSGQLERPWPDAEYALPLLPQSSRRLYATSGWPVVLVPAGREAWRRYCAGELSKSDYYCAPVQPAGTRCDIGSSATL